MLWALLFAVMFGGSTGLAPYFAAQQQELKNVVHDSRSLNEISDSYKNVIRLIKDDKDARSQIIKNILAWGEDPNARLENLVGLVRAYHQERQDLESAFIEKRLKMKKLFKEDEWAQLIQKTKS